MRTTYEIRAGRRAVALEVASSPQEALLSFLRASGSQDADIVRLGAHKASWHGAVYTVAPASGSEIERRPARTRHAG